ncbi:MAG: hypothetical protein WBW53_16430 [Terriglobales bacterium]
MDKEFFGGGKILFDDQPRAIAGRALEEAGILRVALAYEQSAKGMAFDQGSGGSFLVLLRLGSKGIKLKD